MRRVRAEGSYHDGAGVDHASHGLDVDLPGGLVDGGVSYFDAEELGGLVEGRVGRPRHDDFRVGNALLLNGVVSVGLHREHDALRPTRRHLKHKSEKGPDSEVQLKTTLTHRPRRLLVSVEESSNQKETFDNFN